MASSSLALASSFNIASLHPPPSPHQPRLLGANHCFAPLRRFKADHPAFSFASNRTRVVMSASQKKEFNLGGATALALLAAAVIPEIAEAAQPGVSPSLKNLLLSVIAGGVVVLVIGGAVTAVATFDPVTRK